MRGEFPRRSSAVVARRVAGEMLLVPVRGKLADLKGVFALNPVGAFIWDRLDGTVSVADLARAVCEAYEVGLEASQADVHALVEALGDEGLLEAAG